MRAVSAGHGIIEPMTDTNPEQAADDSGTTTEHVHEEVDIDYDVKVPNVRPGARSGLDHAPLNPTDSNAPVDPAATGDDAPAEPVADPPPAPDTSTEAPGAPADSAPSPTDTSTGQSTDASSGDTGQPSQDATGQLDGGTPDAAGEDVHDGGTVVDPSQAITNPGAGTEQTSGDSSDADAQATESASAPEATPEAAAPVDPTLRRPPPSAPPA
jgi:hypothetical protein